MPPKKAPAKPAAGAKKTTAAAKKPAAGGAAAKAAGGTAAKAEPKKEDYKIPDPIIVAAKQIKAVFIEDGQRQIRGTDRPSALVIDNEDGIAARFMPYSGANVFEGIPLIRNPSLTDDDKERIRLAVVNAIRQSKPLVIDIDAADFDVFVELTKRFDEVESGLMNAIVDRSIIKDQWYEKLLRQSDPDGLQSFYFQEENNDKFFLVVLTKNPEPSKELACKFTLFKIDG